MRVSSPSRGHGRFPGPLRRLRGPAGHRLRGTDASCTRAAHASHAHTTHTTRAARAARAARGEGEA